MDMNKKLLNENNIFLSSEYIINGKIIKKISKHENSI
jgi:hypothetical protein